MDQSGQDRSMQNLENAAEGFPQRLMAQSPGCLGGGGGGGNSCVYLWKGDKIDLLSTLVKRQATVSGQEFCLFDSTLFT